MNVYHEWEARYRHEELLRNVAKRQKWDRQSAGGAAGRTLATRVAGWFSAKPAVSAVALPTTFDAIPTSTAPRNTPRKAG